MSRDLKEVEAALAHDLNNCLQVAMGNLEVLRRRAAFVPENVNAALNATCDAAHLADRLVSLGRLKDLEPRALELNAALTDLADMIGRTVGDSVRLDLQLAPDTGKAMVDPRCLQLALLELATNARDAMPAGGRLTMRSAPAPGGLAMIEIADTGAGLPPGRAAGPFNPLYHAAKPALGLYLVERCVEASGGRVEISSDSRGTRVRLYLPNPR